VVDAVPDDSIVGGNPARIIRRRDPVTKAWVRPS
jgi:acetyltransferase-like isoleucine patch superfamily enzyme